MRSDHVLKLLFLTVLAVSAGCGEPSRFGTLPDVGVEGPMLSFLPAKLDVESASPEGWTDTVVKLAPDLPDGAAGMSAADREASSFRTVILADVAKPGWKGTEYALRRIGVGLSLPIQGRDTVVTMGTREAQGVGLSKVSKFALFAFEEDMHQATLLGGNATFALVRTQARLRAGMSYRKVELRYAIVVDPRTGALTRAVWSVEGNRTGPSLVELSGDSTSTIPTAVVIERSSAPISGRGTSGTNELPNVRPQPIPPALAAIAARERYTPAEAAELEKVVRAVFPGQGGVTSPPVAAR
jgi:hypothetical protein